MQTKQNLIQDKQRRSVVADWASCRAAVPANGLWHLHLWLEHLKQAWQRLQEEKWGGAELVGRQCKLAARRASTDVK